ncbi:hypothetical protein E2C01_088538 [Portunus trituberculatus]|uniref:Uncharacterized protein n=1 Tax=Portunus trituberculatus TaxID=210409 RepID=A0A5B7JB17_PORTR|nr:hypothetical protein [Portunus trituberculatus]
MQSRFELEGVAEVKVCNMFRCLFVLRRMVGRCTCVKTTRLATFPVRTCGAAMPPHATLRLVAVTQNPTMICIRRVLPCISWSHCWCWNFYDDDDKDNDDNNDAVVIIVVNK